jgi:hypothetical protein
MRNGSGARCLEALRSLSYAAMSTHPAVAPVWHRYVPKLVTVPRRGYGLEDLRHDVTAGLTVAILALPLAMALAIASGTTSEKGLHTAIIAGLSGLREPPRAMLAQMDVYPDGKGLQVAANFTEALALAGAG